MSSTIRLHNPTGRNTQAHIVELPLVRLYFSYETCIAYSLHSGPKIIKSKRRPNDWGPTTGRHFTELGCENFRCTEIGEDFERELKELCITGQLFG